MNIKLVDRGTEGELLLEGAMDTLSAPETEQIFDLMTQRYDRLILNLSGLDYVFSPGLKLIKKVHLEMQRKGGELVISHPGKPVMEVFELAGLAGMLHFE